MTPSEMAFDPLQDFELATVFFLEKTKKNCPGKEISPAFAGTSSRPKRAKTAIKFLAWDPLEPLLF